MYLNKAMIYGNLTRDPEMKSLPSGIQVVSFSIATNRVYNDRDGKRQEQADYHNVVFFGKQAETVGKYLKKGSGVYVEGRLQTRSWDKDGVKQYRTEIIGDRFQFGPRTDGGGGGSYQNNTAAAGTAPAKDDSPVMPEYPDEEINPEDIPF
jgi:single-strand DNA-binding protein